MKDEHYEELEALRLANIAVRYALKAWVLSLVALVVSMLALALS